MMDFKNASKELMDLIFFGLDHGIESVKGGGLLIPFIVNDTKGKRKLERFVTERIEEGKEKAEEYLKKINPIPQYAIIAYDGFVTIEGKKYDAILVKGFEKGQDKGYVLAQRYKPKAFLKSLKIIGNAAFIGDEDNILKK